MNNERKEEIHTEDIPSIIGAVVILAICVYGLIKFWNA